MVLVPITSPEGPSEMAVPEIVMAGPPGKTEVPATLNPVGLAVKTWPPTVKTALVDDGRDIVLVPMTRPEGPSKTGVPEMVMPGPPFTIVVPAMEMAVGLAVKVWPPTVKTGEPDDEGKVNVSVPITRLPEEPRETGVPDMVTGGPPGFIVVPARTNPVGLAVKV